MSSSQCGRPSLGALPAELVLQILKLLSLRDIFSCQTVSQKFYYIFRHSTELRYIIELKVAGLRERANASPSTPLDECLSQLTRYVATWKRPQMEFERETILSVSRSETSDIWTPVGGTSWLHYAYRDDNPPVEPRLEDHFNRFRALNVSSLACEASTRCDFQGVHAHVGSDAFAIDPDQDLLVTVTTLNDVLTLHPLSLSSGQWHPRGRVGRIDVECQNVHAYGFVISGRRLAFCQSWAVLTEGQQVDPCWYATIIVIDWMSGVLLARIPIPGAIIGTFVLLDETRLLVGCCPRRGPESLLPLTPSLDIYDTCHAADTSQDVQDFRHLASLQLPTFADSFYSVAIYPYLSALESNTAPHTTPFTTDPTARLLYFELECNSVPFCVYFQLITPLEILIKYSVVADAPAIVPWGDWGPSNSRLFKSNTLPRPGSLIQWWTTNWHGTRVMYPDRIWDFNVLDVKRDLHGARAPVDDAYERSCIITQATCIPPSIYAFQEEVITYLPYLETMLEQKLRCDGIILLKDFVVGVVEDQETGEVHLHFYRPSLEIADLSSAAA